MWGIGCRLGLEHILFVLKSAFVMSTDFDYGTAGLPLPDGERVGVRGFGSLDSL
jgi:hypothetical protein